jgi:thioredoxin-related protein
VLAEIEHIDDEADGAGIDFVKIDDKQMAKELGVFALPAVVFFKMGSKEPVIYAGGALYISNFLLLLVYVQNIGLKVLYKTPIQAYNLFKHLWNIHLVSWLCLLSFPDLSYTDYNKIQ